MRREERVRDGLAVTLTVGSGSLDAVCFLALGKVFASVITGNLVLLGIGFVGPETESALHAGVAIAAYIAGVGGAAIAGQVTGGQVTGDGARWPRRVTAVLLVELGLLVAFLVGWELCGARPEGPALLVLLVPAAAAMGLQSIAVQRLAVSGFSTTYLTSTLIAVVTEIVTGTRRQLGIRIVALLGMIGGAVAGTVLWLVAPQLAAVPAPLLLCVVLATATLLRHRGRALTE